MTKKIKSRHSQNLHNQTEVPGNHFNRETLEIIRFRYDFAAAYTFGKKVLEVGCGTGLGLDYLGKNTSSIIGGEFSNENLNICRKIHGNLFNVIKMDAHNILFENSTFDVVVALAMIYYLNTTVFLQQVNRILKSNGRLIFCTSNKDVAGFVAAPHTVKYYSIPELDKILKENGFKPTFYGGFKASGNLIILNEIRGGAKNFVKKIVANCPFGEKAWTVVRGIAMGKLFPLPTKISLLPQSNQRLTLLDSCNRDKIHRIIYVVAEKQT